jgi:ubiquitin-protein ligase E3 C
LLLQPPLEDPALLPLLLDSVLTLPLLPNRLPIPSLTLLSRSLPWPEILTANPTVRSRDRASTINLVSNLSAFGVSRVASWKSAQKDQWAALLARLLNSLDAPLQMAPTGTTSTAAHQSRHDSDDEDAPRPVASGPALSPKMLSHLSQLTSPAHLGGLLSAPSVGIYAFVLALIEAWPAKAKDVLDELGKRRGVLRELWRGFVRSGDVGRKVVMSGGGKGILDALFGGYTRLDAQSSGAMALTADVFRLSRRAVTSLVVAVPPLDRALQQPPALAP